MHASHSTIRTHEDHMNSTRDETPSLRLSMALARGGSLLLILRFALPAFVVVFI